MLATGRLRSVAARPRSSRCWRPTLPPRRARSTSSTSTTPLRRLGELDPDQERLVELRYFGGLTVEGTAETLGTSSATVKRDWQSARAWLFSQLGGGGSPE